MEDGSFLDLMVRYMTVEDLRWLGNRVTDELAKRVPNFLDEPKASCKSWLCVGDNHHATCKAVDLTQGGDIGSWPKVKEPPEGWTQHRANGCRSLHASDTCPEESVVGFSVCLCPGREYDPACPVHKL